MSFNNILMEFDWDVHLHTINLLLTMIMYILEEMSHESSFKINRVKLCRGVRICYGHTPTLICLLVFTWRNRRAAIDISRGRAMTQESSPYQSTLTLACLCVWAQYHRFRGVKSGAGLAFSLICMSICCFTFCVAADKIRIQSRGIDYI